MDRVHGAGHNILCNIGLSVFVDGRSWRREEFKSEALFRHVLDARNSFPTDEACRAIESAD